jgi:phage-related tail fiber protein
MADEVKVHSGFDFLNETTGVNVPGPVNPGDISNKQYVDDAVEAVASGLAWKDDVRVATLSNISLAPAPASVDGVTLVSGDRVLVKDQTAADENGIYEFDGTNLVRASDGDVFDDLESAIVPVSEGTQAGTIWRQTQVNGTIGVDDVLFVAFASETPLATESVAGKAEIATQAEVDAGTDDARFVTPLKLVSSPFAKQKLAVNFGDGSAKTFTLTHNFGTRDVQVEVYGNNSPYDTQIVRVNRPTVNAIEIRVNGPAPALNELRAVIIA